MCHGRQHALTSAVMIMCHWRTLLTSYLSCRMMNAVRCLDLVWHGPTLHLIPLSQVQLSLYQLRYDTIEEYNVDSKAEYSA